MANLRPLTIGFPLGGLDRRMSFQGQPPYTTPYCLNVFPIDVVTGRERGGVRPGLTSLTSRSFAPYHWCPASYDDSGAKEGVAVTFADGTLTTLDGATWTSRITTDPGTDFASCAIFNQFIYQARAGGTCRQKLVVGGSEADLSNAGGGTAPTNCGGVFSHLDCLWLYGDSSNRYRIYKSATGDATNWDYSDRTEGGAWSNTGAEGGQIGHAITAGISHNSRVALIGSARSIYAIPGNPRVYGTRVVSQTIGPLGHNAWCKGLDDEGNNHTYMMSYDGLYVIPSGDYMAPRKLSRKKIPNELLSANPGAGDRVVIGYDGRWAGIHITIDPNSGSNVNYFYHIATDSYWPTEYTGSLHLFPTLPTLQSATKSSILPINSGGTVYQFNSASTEEFDSYLLLGPIRLGGPFEAGMIVTMGCVLADGSQALNWSLHGGDSVEEAYLEAITPDKNTFTGTKFQREGLNYFQQPRRRWNCAFLKLYQVERERWLIEEMMMEIAGAGRRRVG